MVNLSGLIGTFALEIVNNAKSVQIQSEMTFVIAIKPGTLDWTKSVDRGENNAGHEKQKTDP